MHIFTECINLKIFCHQNSYTNLEKFNFPKSGPDFS